MKAWSSNVESAVATTGRVLLAALFLVSGVQKLFVPTMIQGYIASVGLPFPLLVYVLTLVIEIGVGALLLVGFRTRLAAVVLAVFTVVAAMLFHRNLGDPNQFVHFMKNIAIAGGLLHVAARGTESFSLRPK
jgi:putative oxidoreductase